jgi:hypothetical protein
MSQELTMISKLKEKAFGEDYIKLLQRETQLLQEQFAAQSDYRDEIATNLTNDRSDILSYGFDFDANGNITNYDSIYNAEYAAWAQAERDNVVGNITPEEYAAAEKRWKNFTEGI